MKESPEEETVSVSEAQSRLVQLVGEMGAGRVVLSDGTNELGAIVSRHDLELLRLVERFVSHEIASETLAKYGLDSDEDGVDAPPDTPYAALFPVK